MEKLVTCVVSREDDRWQVTWASDGPTPVDYTGDSLTAVIKSCSRRRLVVRRFVRGIGGRAPIRDLPLDRPSRRRDPRHTQERLWPGGTGHPGQRSVCPGLVARGARPGGRAPAARYPPRELLTRRDRACPRVVRHRGRRFPSRAVYQGPRSTHQPRRPEVFPLEPLPEPTQTTPIWPN